MRRGIRETVDDVAWHSRDRRRSESVTRETVSILRQISFPFFLRCNNYVTRMYDQCQNEGNIE